MNRTCIALVALLASGAIAAAPTAGAPEQTPKRGGTVVFGPVREPACLTTFLAVCRGNGVWTPGFEWVAESVLPSAFIVDSDSTRQPRLVSDVEYTNTPPFTLTFRIRREARWSDGVPITARDFAFTHGVIRRFVAPDSGDIHLQVRSVRTVDAKTFKVVLRSRNADWRSLFWTVLPRHALAGESLAEIWEDRIINPKTGRAIGSGPFLVQHWERGKQLTLIRNPRYWGPHVAHLDRIVIRFCQQVCNAPPGGEVLERLRQGEVDFAFARDTLIVSDLRRIRGIKVAAAPSNGWEHFDIRAVTGSHPALMDKRVRRALIYGIDRVAIVRRLFGEIDPKYQPSENAVFLNTSRYYRANWSRYRFRPDLARRLLSEAGCHRGSDGIYVCAGKRLSLLARTSGGQPVRERTLQLAQAHLLQAGVELVPTFGGADADLSLYAWFRFGEPVFKDLYGCGGSLNDTGYCQRLVTADLDQADRILDADQRARVLNRADRQMAKDVRVIPLFQLPLVFAYKAALRGIDPAPNDPFWNAEDWWLDD